MDRSLLVFLDFFFVVFHGSLVLFVLVGWLWSKTRRFHLMLITLTVFSWFGLGYFRGFGYCPCTDWHWRVKQALGESNLPHSYVTYYLTRLTGRDWNDLVVGYAVILVGLTALTISLVMNWRNRASS
jgi:hypothetical protein